MNLKFALTSLAILMSVGLFLAAPAAADPVDGSCTDPNARECVTYVTGLGTEAVDTATGLAIWAASTAGSVADGAIGLAGALADYAICVVASALGSPCPDLF